MITLERTSEACPPAGHYRPARLEDGTRTATAACPDCGRVASLSGHTIADDGTVRPSLVCPNDGCDFHALVRLADWRP